MGPEWGCIDLTGSRQRVKTRKEAHMKTQLSKPARSKARYTDQYKQEALELWRASGRSAAKVAAELGIRPPRVRRAKRSQ
jgi:transposase-like protein